MDGELYLEILYDFLIPSLAKYYVFECNLHQDNDPKHNSLICRSVYTNNGISCVIQHRFLYFKLSSTKKWICN